MAPQAPAAASDAPVPAPSGRRRRVADETPRPVEIAAEIPVNIFAAAAASVAAAEGPQAPQVAPGTGRRRRVVEPAPVVAEAVVEPVVDTIIEPVIEPVVETADPVEVATVTELAPRAHRRAAAKPAKARKPASPAARPVPDTTVARSGHAGPRRKVVALPTGAPSGTALIAGAAAVAVAAAGAIGAADSGSNLAPTNASMAGAAVLGESKASAATTKVDSASVDREQVRASRERARDALADRVRLAAEVQKKQEAAARALAAAKARAQQLALIAKDYSLPVSNYRLTAGFGEGGYRWSNSHTGLDFACAYGSPIRAVAAGTVIFAGWDGSYGYKTIIRHADGTQSWYAHQSQILVRRGQVVAGQIIGRVGMTGNTSGPHLHLEIRVNDNPISPFAWLRAHGLRP